jgi:O-antigen ligase
MSAHADRLLLDLSLRLPGWAILIASFSCAALLGWAYVDRPTLAVLPALLLLALPLVLSARVRLLVIVFGALTVFQSSDELTASKLLYLMALAVSFGAVLVRLPSLIGTRAYRDLTPLLRASVVLFALVLVSLPVATFNDVPQKTWLRDVAPYVMVACAPFFALDAQASLTTRALKRILIVGGTLGALGFTARWLTNRQIADLSFIPVGLPTLLLAATVFAFGVAALLHGNRNRLAWATFTALILAMLLSTGSRTALILLAAPLAIAVGSHDRLAQRSLRLLVVTPLVALLVFLGAEGITLVTHADREALAARATLLFETGHGETDHSYIDRLAQADAAWDLFRASPVVGAGPGTTISWTDAFGDVRDATSVDSSLSFPAKFGLVGLVAAGFLVVGYLSTLRRFRARTRRPTVVQLATLGFGAVVVAWSLLHNPYEDKGLAIGMILLFALAAREASDAALEDVPETARSRR